MNVNKGTSKTYPEANIQKSLKTRLVTKVNETNRH